MVDILDMAVYTGCSLLSKGLSVSPLKLQKILYYEQAWYMVFFGRENTLFADKPQAWVNGPVYPVVFNKYKSMVKGMCDHLSESDFCGNEDINDVFCRIKAKMGLNAEEVECLESVISMYGAKSQNHLIFLTHSELPWSEKREGLMPYDKSTAEISLDTMFNYYSERYRRNHPDKM